MTITFDKSSAEFVLQALADVIETTKCSGNCGNEITPETLGAICKIEDKTTLWCSKPLCIMAFATERKKHGIEL